MNMRLVTTQITLASILLAVLLAFGILADYFLATHAIGISNHRWCSTLQILTEPPVPAPAHGASPVQQRQYTLYLRFRELQRDFGCE